VRLMRADAAGRRRPAARGGADRGVAAAASVAGMTERSDALPEAERREILDRAVTKYLRHGYSLESNTGRQAVVSRPQRVNVLLNLLLVLLTGGLWLIVVALQLLNRPKDRVVLTIDERGVLQGEFF
jgi:hypothetical protein